MHNHPDRIEIDSDEIGRWWIEVHHATGFTLYEIPDPEALYDQVKARIGPWLRERDEARGGWKAAADRYHAAFMCNPDESGGYDISDPKHPDHHSVHADIWDAREGK